MERYLIDTNTVCDYLSSNLPAAGMAFLDAVIDEIPNLSVITQIELLCWITNIQTEQNVRSFISDSNVLNINDESVMYCAVIRRGKKVKTPDAIIAATALAHDYTLITNNEKDFRHIKGLKLINPHKL